MDKEIGQPTDEKKEDEVPEKTEEQPKIESSRSVIDNYNKDDGEYKINVIRDFYGAIDITFLNKKDENFEYRWLNTNKANLAKKTHNILSALGGWQLCSKKFVMEKLGVAEGDVGPDGLYYRGADLVLAFMPKELYHEKMQLKKKKADSPLEAIFNEKKEVGGTGLSGHKEGVIKIS